MSHTPRNNIPSIRKIRGPQAPHDLTHVTRARVALRRVAAAECAASKPPNGRSVRLIYFLYFRFKLTDRAR